MTSKVKGQPKRGSLADMTIYPNDDCHEQPPQGDVESMPTRMDLDDGHRLDYTRYYGNHQ
jgi:hypothetical protein